MAGRAEFAKAIAKFGESRSGSPRTTANYLGALERFMAWLGSARKRSVDAAAIKAYYAELDERVARGGLTSSSASAEASAIREFLRWAPGATRLITRREAERALAVAPPRGGPREVARLSDEHLGALLEAAREAAADSDPGGGLRGARDLALVMVLWRGALRVPELTALLRADFQPTASGGRKLAVGDTRQVPLPGEAWGAIERWIERRDQVADLGGPGEDRPLFCTLHGGGARGGGPGTALQRWSVSEVLGKLFERAQIETKGGAARLLRDTGAAMYAAAGMDIAALQQFLGEADLARTSVYYPAADADVSETYYEDFFERMEHSASDRREPADDDGERPKRGRR